MFKRFRQMWAARRRRRAILTIRREFARSGYLLDGLADAEIEASLPPETFEDPASRLGAKTISRALRRLPAGSVRRRRAPRDVTPLTRGDELRKGRLSRHA
jgi:hypothetical protein